jgi:hypothetical protein
LNAGEAIIARYSTARRAVNRLLAELRKRIPPFTKLPYVVMAVAWSGEDGRPAPGEWQRMLDGEIEIVDAPGHEESNRPFHEEPATRHMMQPKMYINFDPDKEFGVDP